MVEEAELKEQSKNRIDAEKKVSETIRAEVDSGKEISIESIIHKVDEALEPNNEHVQQVMKNSILVRGSIIETAIHLESIINEIILQYYNPSNHNLFKRDFLFKTLGLSQKKDILCTLVRNENLKEKISVSFDFGKDFLEFIRIRNIYAHYPEDVFNDEGKIEVSHNEFSSIKELNQSFYSIVQKLDVDLHKIAIFIAEKNISESLGKK